MSTADRINGYFLRSEFACKCGCGFDAVDTQLFDIITAVRETFGKPVTITSGCRCAAHNAAVGGSPKSQHLFAKACDIKVKDTSPQVVYDFLNDVMRDFGGLGLYSSWVHVDVRSEKARWKR